MKTFIKGLFSLAVQLHPNSKRMSSTHFKRAPQALGCRWGPCLMFYFAYPLGQVIRYGKEIFPPILVYSHDFFRILRVWSISLQKYLSTFELFFFFLPIRSKKHNIFRIQNIVLMKMWTALISYISMKKKLGSSFLLKKKVCYFCMLNVR